MALLARTTCRRLGKPSRWDLLPLILSASPHGLLSSIPSTSKPPLFQAPSYRRTKQCQTQPRTQQKGNRHNQAKFFKVTSKATPSSPTQNSVWNSQCAAFSSSAGSTQVNHHHVRINQPILSQASLSCKNQHQGDLKPNGILSPKEAFCPGTLGCNGHIVFHLKSGHCILSVL